MVESAVDGILYSILANIIYERFRIFFENIIPRDMTRNHLEQLDIDELRFESLDDYEGGIEELIILYDRICQLEGLISSLVSTIEPELEEDFEIDDESIRKIKNEINNETEKISEIGRDLRDYETIKKLIWCSLSWTHRNRILGHIEEEGYENVEPSTESIFLSSNLSNIF